MTNTNAGLGDILTFAKSPRSPFTIDFFIISHVSGTDEESEKIIHFPERKPCFFARSRITAGGGGFA